MTSQKFLRGIVAIAVVGIIVGGLLWWAGSDQTMSPLPATRIHAPSGYPDKLPDGSVPDYEPDPTPAPENPDDVWEMGGLIPNSRIDVNTLTTTKKLANAFAGFYLYTMPAIYINQLPSDFAQKGSPNLFVKAVAPLLLKENKTIRQDRAFLLDLQKKMNEKIAWTPEQTARFDQLVKTYQVVSQKIPQTQLNELLQKVDSVPLSLALAQMGVQTDWGKMNMNAPFGQYEWVNGTYQLKTFDRLKDAVHSYMLELNSLPQYQNWRVKRGVYKNLRGSLGGQLLDIMGNYMPNDAGYVKSLQDAYQNMQLAIFDEAELLEPAPSLQP